MKMVTRTGWMRKDGEVRRIYTNVLGQAELAALDGLELGAMIFQERVEKACELRVTAVGRRLFTAAVDSQTNPGSAIDWRREQEAIGHTWKPHALPRVVEKRLIALLEHFGLGYGAFDLILTPAGRHVFLELNREPLAEYACAKDSSEVVKIQAGYL